ncbi:MAG TPA: thioredoxin family protein [Niastella sp.]
MKFLFVLLIAAISLSFTKWQTDFEKAKELARDENKIILLNFSGSDWCGPCIRLRKEVFASEAFQQLADNSLVLMNADFPRDKKNQLSKDLQRQNEILADRYNPTGKFPYSVLLNADGSVIQSWEGYPQNNSQLFISQIKSVCNVHHH